MLSKDFRQDRFNWPMHRRAYAVLREEGVRGVFRRVGRYVRAYYWRWFPPDPTEIYDAAFFRMSRHTNAYCEVFAGWLAYVFKPSAVLDVGCGDCSLLLALSRHDVVCYGLDGSSEAVRAAPGDVLVFHVDLNKPFLLNRTFPLVCCIEVAEHLSRKSGETLISSLVEHAGETIVFSAAHPGQGGVVHINEQPREYWTRLFAQHGWVEDVARTTEAKNTLTAAGAPDYLKRNIIVLSQRTSLSSQSPPS